MPMKDLEQMITIGLKYRIIHMSGNNGSMGIGSESSADMRHSLTRMRYASSWILPTKKALKE